jgi:hypothetical protein
MKRIVRIVCALGVLAAALSTGANTASAGTITCQYYCSGVRHIATCYTNLANCCNVIQHMCPDPAVFEGGECVDGPNYCYA